VDVTATVYVPREVDETALAEWLERQFDAGWFPEHHSFGIMTDDASATIDLVREDSDDGSADRVRSAGFVPKAVLYVSTVGHHRGSPPLVERVAGALAQHLGGRVAALDPPAAGRA
jgi:hypothetical protein